MIRRGVGRGTSGFTLIEAVVALAIFASSAVMLLSVGLSLQRSVIAGRRADAAMALAQSRLVEAERLGLDRMKRLDAEAEVGGERLHARMNIEDTDYRALSWLVIEVSAERDGPPLATMRALLFKE